MLKFEGKVSRALKRQRIRMQLQMPAIPKEEANQRQYKLSASGTGTSRKTETSSRSSIQRKGEKAKNKPQIAPRLQALLHKIKNQQRKIKARTTAVRNVICHADIMDNPGKVWLDGIKTELYGKMTMCSEENQRRWGDTDQQLQTTRLTTCEGRPRRDTTDTMQIKLDNPRSTESGEAQTRLLPAQPQMYSGAVADYVQWRRSWQERGRDSEESEEVQLKQLKMTIPEKTSNQMGLAEEKTIKGFWIVFDKNYYNALAKASVEFEKK
jgi:hypothetical protein